MCHHSDDLKKCEYVVKVEWVVRKKREDALKKSGLFYAQRTQAEVTDEATLDYIEDKWDVSFDKILEGENS
jgi:hypothetical protein